MTAPQRPERPGWAPPRPVSVLGRWLGRRWRSQAVGAASVGREPQAKAACGFGGPCRPNSPSWQENSTSPPRPLLAALLAPSAPPTPPLAIGAAGEWLEGGAAVAKARAACAFASGLTLAPPCRAGEANGEELYAEVLTPVGGEPDTSFYTELVEALGEAELRGRLAFALKVLRASAELELAIFTNRYGGSHAELALQPLEGDGDAEAGRRLAIEIIAGGLPAEQAERVEGAARARWPNEIEVRHRAWTEVVLVSGDRHIAPRPGVGAEKEHAVVLGLGRSSSEPKGIKKPESRRKRDTHSPGYQAGHEPADPAGEPLLAGEAWTAIGGVYLLASPEAAERALPAAAAAEALGWVRTKSKACFCSGCRGRCGVCIYCWGSAIFVGEAWLADEHVKYYATFLRFLESSARGSESPLLQCPLAACAVRLLGPSRPSAPDRDRLFLDRPPPPVPQVSDSLASALGRRGGQHLPLRWAVVGKGSDVRLLEAFGQGARMLAIPTSRRSDMTAWVAAQQPPLPHALAPTHGRPGIARATQEESVYGGDVAPARGKLTNKPDVTWAGDGDAPNGGLLDFTYYALPSEEDAKAQLNYWLFLRRSFAARMVRRSYVAAAWPTVPAPSLRALLRAPSPPPRQRRALPPWQMAQAAFIGEVLECGARLGARRVAKSRAVILTTPEPMRSEASLLMEARELLAGLDPVRVRMGQAHWARASSLVAALVTLTGRRPHPLPAQPLAVKHPERGALHAVGGERVYAAPVETRVAAVAEALGIPAKIVRALAIDAAATLPLFLAGDARHGWAHGHSSPLYAAQLAAASVALAACSAAEPWRLAAEPPSRPPDHARMQLLVTLAHISVPFAVVAIVEGDESCEAEVRVEFGGTAATLVAGQRLDHRRVAVMVELSDADVVASVPSVEKGKRVVQALASFATDFAKAQAGRACTLRDEKAGGAAYHMPCVEAVQLPGDVTAAALLTYFASLLAAAANNEALYDYVPGCSPAFDLERPCCARGSTRHLCRASSEGLDEELLLCHRYLRRVTVAEGDAGHGLNVMRERAEFDGLSASVRDEGRWDGWREALGDTADELIAAMEADHGAPCDERRKVAKVDAGEMRRWAREEEAEAKAAPAEAAAATEQAAAARAAADEAAVAEAAAAAEQAAAAREAAEQEAAAEAAAAAEQAAAELAAADRAAAELAAADQAAAAKQAAQAAKRYRIPRVGAAAQAMPQAGVPPLLPQAMAEAAGMEAVAKAARASETVAAVAASGGVLAGFPATEVMAALSEVVGASAIAEAVGALRCSGCRQVVEPLVECVHCCQTFCTQLSCVVTPAMQTAAAKRRRVTYMCLPCESEFGSYDDSEWPVLTPGGSEAGDDAAAGEDGAGAAAQASAETAMAVAAGGAGAGGAACTGADEVFEVSESESEGAAGQEAAAEAGQAATEAAAEAAGAATSGAATPAPLQDDSVDGWTCRSCTYAENPWRSGKRNHRVLSCGMCGARRAEDQVELSVGRRPNPAP